MEDMMRLAIRVAVATAALLLLAVPLPAGANTVNAAGGQSLIDTIYETCTEGQLVKIVSGAEACASDSTGGTPAFNAVTSGTNTTAAMVVSTGSSLATTGSGSIIATTGDSATGFFSAGEVETARIAATLTSKHLTTSTADTAAANDSDTSVASTAYVQQEINGAGGAGLACSSGSCATASQETSFLADGGTTPLTCGGSASGKAQVMDDGTFQACDGATTSVLRTFTPSTVWSGATAVNPSSISSGACNSADTTATATGVASTDVISWTPNADISGVTGYAPVTTGGVIIYVFPTANTVNFRVCNPTSSSIDPGSITINWRVER